MIRNSDTVCGNFNVLYDAPKSFQAISDVTPGVEGKNRGVLSSTVPYSCTPYRTGTCSTSTFLEEILSPVISSRNVLVLHVRYVYSCTTIVRV